MSLISVLWKRKFCIDCSGQRWLKELLILFYCKTGVQRINDVFHKKKIHGFVFFKVWMKNGWNWSILFIYIVLYASVHKIRKHFFKIFDTPLLFLRNAKPYKSLYFYKGSLQIADPLPPKCVRILCTLPMKFFSLGDQLGGLTYSHFQNIRTVWSNPSKLGRHVKNGLLEDWHNSFLPGSVHKLRKGQINWKKVINILYINLKRNLWTLADRKPLP